jgi:hypothetical protein
MQQNIIEKSQVGNILAIEGERFINASRFDTAIRKKAGITDEEKLPVIKTAYTQKGIPARLTTFLFSLLAAVLSTLFLPSQKKPVDVPGT